MREAPLAPGPGPGGTGPQAVSRRSPAGGDAHSPARGNVLLDELDDADLDRLRLCLDPVDLPVGAVLQEPGSPARQVLFPLSGVVSLQVELEDSVRVEARTIGREGVLGLSAYLGVTPSERAHVVVAGRALVLPAAEFARQVAIIDGPLERVLRRYAGAVFSQLARNAACNRVHSVGERTARWLLSAADRTDGQPFGLTQDSLAQVLSVRRASVNRAAQDLADTGCISYARGTVTVHDREGLLTWACSCYRALG